MRTPIWRHRGRRIQPASQSGWLLHTKPGTNQLETAQIRRETGIPALSPAGSAVAICGELAGPTRWRMGPTISGGGGGERGWEDVSCEEAAVVWSLWW
jgi:hypothetical protein